MHLLPRDDQDNGKWPFQRFESAIAKCGGCEKRKTQDLRGFVGNEKECICEACHGGGGGAAAGGALKRKAECIDLT